MINAKWKEEATDNDEEDNGRMHATESLDDEVDRHDHQELLSLMESQVSMTDPRGQTVRTKLVNAKKNLIQATN
jgi:hypothetical protein